MIASFARAAAIGNLLRHLLLRRNRKTLDCPEEIARFSLSFYQVKAISYLEIIVFLVQGKISTNFSLRAYFPYLLHKILLLSA